MIKIGKKTIGDNFKTFVTFEAGPTHNGFESAKNLITHAAMSGADAIKFQIIDADKLMADKSVMFEYQYLENKGNFKKTEESLYELLKRRMLKQKEWMQLKKISDELGILFFATVGFKEEVDFLKRIGCDSIKIASSDVNYHGLIEYAADQGLCIQLDTGNSTLGEIEEAVDIIRSKNNNNIIIHHCPSGYPAKSDKINLKIIKTLKTMFPFPIGFSDHSPGWDMDIAAISLGANLVEKTITENKFTKSVEHAFSLDIHEFSPFVKKIREIETAMGSPRRILGKKEIEKRKSVRRSAYLVNDEKKYTYIDKIKFEFKRPGYGISPNELKKFFKKKLNKNLNSGDLLKHDDIE